MIFFRASLIALIVGLTINSSAPCQSTDNTEGNTARLRSLESIAGLTPSAKLSVYERLCNLERRLLGREQTGTVEIRLTNLEKRAPKQQASAASSNASSSHFAAQTRERHDSRSTALLDSISAASAITPAGKNWSASSSANQGSLSPASTSASSAAIKSDIRPRTPSPASGSGGYGVSGLDMNSANRWTRNQSKQYFPDGTTITAYKNGEGTSYDCLKGKAIITASNGDLTFRGSYGRVSVSGNNNRLVLHNVTELVVSGNDNNIFLSGRTEPKIINCGKKNSITRRAMQVPSAE